jgi:zinc and cadmium transporter
MSFLTPFLISLVAGSATILGLVLIYFARNWVQKYSVHVVSVAAGVLLGTAFFHLFPEAQELVGEGTYFWILIGFVCFFIIEAFVGFHACREEDESSEKSHEHVLGAMAGLGIFVHSILDGVAIGIGYEVSPEIGLITAIAVMVHELPEGIFTFSLLLHSGMKLKKAVWWTLAVALATPLGTLVTLLIAPEISERNLGVLLAMAGGSFLYIAASDLIPESHKARSLRTAALTLLGLVFVFFLNRIGH